MEPLEPLIFEKTLTINGVTISWYRDISWHPEKGVSPLDKLGITISLKEGATTPEPAMNNPVGEELPRKQELIRPLIGARHGMAQLDFHNMVLQLHDEGYSYRDITAKLREKGIVADYHTVRNHVLGICKCKSEAGKE